MKISFGATPLVVGGGDNVLIDALDKDAAFVASAGHGHGDEALPTVVRGWDSADRRAD